MKTGIEAEEFHNPKIDVIDIMKLQTQTSSTKPKLINSEHVTPKPATTTSRQPITTPTCCQQLPTHQPYQPHKLWHQTKTPAGLSSSKKMKNRNDKFRKPETKPHVVTRRANTSGGRSQRQYTEWHSQKHRWDNSSHLKSKHSSKAAKTAWKTGQLNRKWTQISKILFKHINCHSTLKKKIVFWQTAQIEWLPFLL